MRPLAGAAHFLESIVAAEIEFGIDDHDVFEWYVVQHLDLAAQPLHDRMVKIRDQAVLERDA